MPALEEQREALLPEQLVEHVRGVQAGRGRQAARAHADEVDVLLGGAQVVQSDIGFGPEQDQLLVADDGDGRIAAGIEREGVLRGVVADRHRRRQLRHLGRDAQVPGLRLGHGGGVAEDVGAVQRVGSVARPRPVGVEDAGVGLERQRIIDE